MGKYIRNGWVFLDGALVVLGAWKAADLTVYALQHLLPWVLH